MCGELANYRFSLRAVPPVPAVIQIQYASRMGARRTLPEELGTLSWFFAIAFGLAWGLIALALLFPAQAVLP
jgi:hypothetical protein